LPLLAYRLIGPRGLPSALLGLGDFGVGKQLQTLSIMFSKVLIDNIMPVTQSAQAIAEMLIFLGMPSELPAVLKLADGAQLTKSSKGDCYYYTTPRGCSCPGFTYRHTCKHVKALAGPSLKPRGQTIEQTLEEHDRNLHKMPASYRRMVRAAREVAEAEDDPDSLIKRGGFRPVFPGDEPSEIGSKHDKEA